MLSVFRYEGIIRILHEKDMDHIEMESVIFSEPFLRKFLSDESVVDSILSLTGPSVSPPDMIEVEQTSAWVWKHLKETVKFFSWGLEDSEFELDVTVDCPRYVLLQELIDKYQNGSRTKYDFADDQQDEGMQELEHTYHVRLK